MSGLGSTIFVIFSIVILITILIACFFLYKIYKAITKKNER